MKLGYSPTTASVLELDDAYKLAVELGLEFVELAFELQEISAQVQPPARVIELSRATGVGTTVHLPFTDLNLASLIPKTRALAVERVQRGLDYAAAVGARCGVLHSGQNPFYHPLAVPLAENALRASLAALVASVPVALENLALSRADFVRGPDALQALTAEAGFANCFDFGHAFVEGCAEDCVDERGAQAGASAGDALITRYLDVLGDRVIHLHLHGNDGSADQHLATDEGRVPYARYAGFLNAFEGTACLEVAGGREALARSVAHIRALAATPAQVDSAFPQKAKERAEGSVEETAKPA